MRRITLCWSCAKCTDGNECEWACGVERDDWIIKRTANGIIVIECDGYVADWVSVTLAEFKSITNSKYSSMANLKSDKLKQIAKAAGYRLKIEQDGRNREFYIKKKPPSVKIADKI